MSPDQQFLRGPGVISLDIPDQSVVDFKYPPSNRTDSLFLMSMHKCGSTLLNNLSKAICQEARLPLVDIPGSLFVAGIENQFWENYQPLRDCFIDGYIYGGLRFMPGILKNHPVFLKSRKLFFTRDPRDALVSQYFSFAYSHVIPKQGSLNDRLTKIRAEAQNTAIDDWCLQASENSIQRWTDMISVIGNDPLTTLLRYEDLIFDKLTLVNHICAFYGCELSENTRKGIAQHFDIVPDKEQPDKHIRFVRPGNHKDKLKPETIEIINQKYAPILDRFGYQ